MPCSINSKYSSLPWLLNKRGLVVYPCLECIVMFVRGSGFHNSEGSLEFNIDPYMSGSTVHCPKSSRQVLQLST